MKTRLLPDLGDENSMVLLINIANSCRSRLIVDDCIWICTGIMRNSKGFLFSWYYIRRCLRMCSDITDYVYPYYNKLHSVLPAVVFFAFSCILGRIAVLQAVGRNMKDIPCDLKFA